MTSKRDLHGSELAIIGMAGRFPDANSVEEFWRNLREGVDSVKFLSDDELRAAGVEENLLKNPAYVKATMMLEGVEMFDASFFGYTPREAEIMDPQHRLFLECAREALENAAYDPETYQGLAGVFAGSGFPTYFLDNVLTNPEVMELMGMLQAAVGNERDSLASTISYKMNLKGPSLAVQTFCSTSLVAVHLACQSLLSYECDMALAGGVAIGLPQGVGYLYQAGGIASPDGHCRTFDAKAQGSIYGSGLGIVVLRRLEDALADGDHIHAVIKGSAINNDGSVKVGYTAPGLDGQSSVIVEAVSNAGVEMDTISYIETHGTATPLGDSIELAALMKAFHGRTENKQFCAIGSVKPNIGHLDRASGVTNLIKAALALKHGEIPPSLHYEEANPDIDFENSPFYVNTKLSKWESGDDSSSPRRAGVNSFGLGGTNAHVVLEEAPAVESSATTRPAQLIVLSAKTESALEAATINLARHLRQHPELNFADVAYTLRAGRSAFNHRRALVSTNLDDAATALESLDPKRIFTLNQETRNRPVAFMLSGVGDHYRDMARGLYETEASFRAIVDECCELLQPIIKLDLRTLIFNADTSATTSTATGNGIDLRRMLGRTNSPDAAETPAEADLLQQTRYAQPAVFVVEYALSQLLMSWGIRPSALIGYSLGEYVCATLAGVFRLEDALTLVARRAELIEGVERGAMLAVALPEVAVRELLGEGLSIAIINSPQLCVVAGTEAAISAFEARLAEKEVVSRRLPTTHAFHSGMMLPIKAEYERMVEAVERNAPQIAYVSNVTGDWIDAEEAVSAGYWARHMCEAVRFGEGVEKLLAERERVLVEVGAGQTLSSIVKQQAGYRKEMEEGGERIVVSTLRYEYERERDEEFLLRSVGRLWLAGVEIEWSGYYEGERRLKVELPTYPFERQRYWLEPGVQAPIIKQAEAASGKKEDMGEWFYQSVWAEAKSNKNRKNDLTREQTDWIILADEHGVGSELVESLKQKNQSVIVVRAGEGFARLDDDTYAIDPSNLDDYHALIKEVVGRGAIPTRIVSLWNVSEQCAATFDEAQQRGFYSLVNLAKALAAQRVTSPIQIDVVSNFLQAVEAGDEVSPEKATLLGPCKVLPQEYPNLTCRSIDVGTLETGTDGRTLVEGLFAELTTASADLTVAYRRGRRFVQSYESLRLEEAAGASGLREGGVYLITGGLGGVGLVLAEHLAREFRAKLVLTGRAGLPERETWGEWLATHEENDGVSRKIRKIQSLEETGAEVLALSADVADARQMREVFARATEKFGALHGVIYAAGISDEKSFSVVQDITPSQCEQHFQPKVHGLLVLEEVLDGHELDFCFLFSSLSAVLGGILFSAYAAANLFMDSFARKQNRAGGTRWIAVNWDSWKVREQEIQDARYKRLESTVADFAMTPDEGAEAFRRILSADKLTHVVNSTADLQKRLDQWIRRTDLREGTAAARSGKTATLYSRPNLQNAYVPVTNTNERRVAEVFQRVLGIEKVGIHDNYFDLGGNSLLSIQVIAELQKEFDMQVSPIAIFEAPTVSELAKLLSPAGSGESKADAFQHNVDRRRRTGDDRGTDIAIVGMAGRFPGAKNVNEFWRNVRDGVESVSFFSDRELAESGVDPQLVRDPAYIPARPILDGIDMFDAAFFGYSPREAELIDPQHRIFIESAWEALESAGYDSHRYDGSIGVFAGSNMSHYILRIFADPDVASTINDFEAGLGNERDSLTTRVSYKLNLRGPSFAVQTFCSTSLVAVHLACQSILNGECDMALAGGVALKLPTKVGYVFRDGDQVSADGHTRTFDAKAKGTVFGDGVGVVLLKRLADALADGDCIQAIIKGSALNNDGSLKVGYTAPSVEGQAEVVAVALANAGVSADSLSYVEAHGTATELGDPIEVAALAKAFRLSTSRTGFCALGSVKTNVGHLDRAAGVTGLIKTVQALRHRQLPPSLFYETPNPKIDFDTSPFFVNRELGAWVSDGGRPRRAGVNSLGVGGTNVHVVVEEAPAAERASGSRPWQLLLLSARSQEALEAATGNLVEHLRANVGAGELGGKQELGDVAYTLQVGRREFNHRRMVVCATGAEGAGLLESGDARRVYSHYQEPKNRPVAFMLGGVGDHYRDMARGLYETEASFRAIVDECCELLRPTLKLDLRTLIFSPESATTTTSTSSAATATGNGIDLRRMLGRSAAASGETSPELDLLQQTRYAQPAVFVVEYALSQLLMSWGIRPSALIGYSLGEYVCATLAGVFRLEDALTLVARRAELIEGVERGAMLAVALPEVEVRALLGEGVSIAIINSPQLCVVAGTEAAISAFEARLAEKEVVSRRLPTTHAFHSGMMLPIKAEYERMVEAVERSAPQITYVSNVTGDWIDAEEAVSAGYWARHMCEAVRFGEGVEKLLAERERVLVEVGAGQTLSSIVKQQAGYRKEMEEGGERIVVSTLRYEYERERDEVFLLTGVGKLWLAGVEIEWSGYYEGERRHRVELPTYPFERQRYWIETRSDMRAAPQAAAGKKAEIADWFYEGVWRERESAKAGTEASGEKRAARGSVDGERWLILEDEAGIGEELGRRLRESGDGVVSVRAGEHFAPLGRDAYSVSPGMQSDYDRLFEALTNQGQVPTRVVHLWSVTDEEAGDPGLERFAKYQDLGYQSLICLAKAFGKRFVNEWLDVVMVSSHVQEVSGDETLCPEKATLLGPCKSIPQEYININVRSIDILPEQWQEGKRATLVSRLIADALSDAPDLWIAYRDDRRLVQTFEPLRVEGVDAGTTVLREGGVYLITGGLGGVGLVLARHLAQKVGAKLLLTNRSGLPERDAWEQWLETHEEDDGTAAKIRRVRELEELGAEVLIVRADVADEEQMREAVAQAHQRFGALHGVIHGAGIPSGQGFRVMQELEPADSEYQFQAKVYGLFVLEKVLAGQNLDFCLLVSSLASVLGGITMAAYSAANTFMDAFARRHNQMHGDDWLSVNWDTWQLRLGQHDVIGKTVAAFEMLPDEGADAFERLVSRKPATQIVNSTGDLQSRLDQWVKRKFPQEDAGAAKKTEAPKTYYSRPNLQTTYIPATNEMEERIAAIWQQVLGIEKVGIHDNYFELGGTSLSAIQVISNLQKELNVPVSPIALFEAPTVHELTKRFAPARAEESRETALSKAVKRRRKAKQNREGQHDIAIIGMAGRFPGATNVREFWRNVRDGVESVSFFSDRELAESGVDPQLVRDPAYIPARPILDGIDMFDAAFFGYSPREAELIDPQHRIFIESAWEALESAGYDSHRYDGSIGVFAGANISSYGIYLIQDPAYAAVLNGLDWSITNASDSLTTRVSYKLNLRGPSFLVNTFCSTSLVAVHLACQSILNGECDMALAGGVSIKVPQKTGYQFDEGGQDSPDGHTRTFDAKAKGTVFGDGVGVVLLKRLADALADGDCIQAIIKGSALNNDGSLKVGYTAPSVEGQAEVVAVALANAGVSADSLSYVEAHGTATELGDPIEVAALAKAFRLSTSRTGFCALGSVKTNVGHLDRAAGVTGLIKTVQALRHRQLPPSLFYETPNPKIDFDTSPFFVNRELGAWVSDGGRPRRAGVNSLGVGGTNVHVVVEEAPAAERASGSRPWQLLLLSARSQEALEAATGNLVEHLRANVGAGELGGKQELGDVAYTLQVGRREFNHRRMVVCATGAEGAGLLESGDARRVYSHYQEPKNRPVAFMLGGVGDHYRDMARGLYETEASFRAIVDECCELLRPTLKLDLRTLIFNPESATTTTSTSSAATTTGNGIDLRRMLGRSAAASGETSAEADLLQQTRYAQPAVFVVEYALSQLLMSWGIRPSALIGYSLGEYVCATLAGVFRLEDALSLVARRAELIEGVERGAMLAVALPEVEVRELLGEGLSIAIINSPQLCVVAGTEAAISAFEARLAEKEVVSRRLPTTHAFHSGMMLPIKAEYERMVEAVERSAPQIAYVSNVTGDWIDAEEAVSAGYWARHMCEAVRFGEGVEKLLAERERVLVEVGAGQTLSSIVKQQAGYRKEMEEGAERIVVSTLRYEYERERDEVFLLTGVGKLWLAGVELSWAGYYEGERRRRVELPTYPFERQRYWLEPKNFGAKDAASFEHLQKNPDLAKWFYLPTWKQAVPLIAAPAVEETGQGEGWLVMTDGSTLASTLVEQLIAQGAEVVSVAMGDGFEKISEGFYAIDPKNRDDYDSLLKEVGRGERMPRRIVHLWNLSESGAARSGLEAARETLDAGFYSLMFLTQALGEQDVDAAHITIIASGMYQVMGDDKLSPAKATLLGPCRVIPQELSSYTCRTVDIIVPEPGSRQEQQVVSSLVRELTFGGDDSVLAYRHGQRWVQGFEPLPLAPAPPCGAQPGDGAAPTTAACLAGAQLRERGVYLITGGTGGIGLAVAEHLARSVRARLVLTGRTALPPRGDWDALIEGADPSSPVVQKIWQVRGLEESGAEVLVLAADVSDVEQMRRVVEEAETRFGTLDGVFHAAGVPGAGLIQLKTAEVAAGVLAPKVAGTVVLDEVLGERALDFIVLFSSMTSIVGGGPGQLDYCAANAFLDAYAQEHNGAGGRVVVAINWGEWQWNAWEEGLAGFDPEIQEFFRENRRKIGISFPEGMDAIGRILATGLPQVVVSTQNFHAVIEGSKSFTVSKVLQEAEKLRGGEGSSHPRPKLGTTYVEPTNEVERTIATAWQDILGINQVGIQDNFFEMGGHSLLATQLFSRLRRTFDVKLSLRSIFELPTVADQAQMVQTLRWTATDEEMLVPAGGGEEGMVEGEI